MKKLALLFVYSVGITFAASSCDAVIDNGVPGIDLPLIFQATQELTAQGADVRVVVEPHLQAATLDDQELQTQRLCASWQAPGGGRKNNLIVLMVAALDRKTGLYYGSQWKSALDSQWPRIQSAVMNPRFRDGHFAQGIAAGFAEIKRVITAPPVGVINIQQPPAAPLDLSGLWPILGWVVGLVTLGFALFWGIWEWRQYRDRREKRLTAQQRALAAQTQATQLYAAVSEIDLSEHQELKDAVYRASIALSKAGYGALDPSNQTLSAPEYAFIADLYEGICRDLEATITQSHGVPAQASKESAAKPAKSAKKVDTLPVTPEKPVSSHTTTATDNLITWPTHTVFESRPRTFVEAVTPVPIYIPEPVVMPERYPDPPSESSSYTAPEPASPSFSDSSSGGSSDWGSSSSDGGGSVDFGSSTSDGGGSTSW